MLPVLNQYHFSPDSRTACVAISIMALYHQYTNLDRSLGDREWHAIMERGTELYKRWCAQDPARGLRLPTVHQVLAIPDCRPFVDVFGTQPIEFAGLVRDANGIDQPEGSLRHMLHEMTRQCRDEAKTLCCLLVLPRVICVSVLAVPAKRHGEQCELRFFDSHDTQSIYCDYRVFSDADTLLQYILQKYPVGSWSASESAQRNGNNEFIESTTTTTTTTESIERVQANYGYSACMFIK